MKFRLVDLTMNATKTLCSQQEFNRIVHDLKDPDGIDLHDICDAVIYATRQIIGPCTIFDGCPSDIKGPGPTSIMELTTTTYDGDLIIFYFKLIPDVSEALEYLEPFFGVRKEWYKE